MADVNAVNKALDEPANSELSKPNNMERLLAAQASGELSAGGSEHQPDPAQTSVATTVKDVNKALNEPTSELPKPNNMEMLLEAQASGELSPGGSKRHQEDENEEGEGFPTKRNKVKEQSAGKTTPGPEYWAKNRMSLCETLHPFYRAYKSSLYTANNVAIGMYLDAGAREHDVLRAQVIVTSVGGGRVRDEATNTMTMVQDMTEANRSYNYMTNARNCHAPILVIAGSGHPVLAAKSPHELTVHEFNVLGFFHCTDVWAELNVVGAPAKGTEGANKEPKTVRVFSVRLEKADLSLKNQSWWDPTPNHHVEVTDAPAAPWLHCSTCLSSSKVILELGWTCLNRMCPKFFKNTHGQKITSVVYSELFLQERTTFVGAIPVINPAGSFEEAIREGYGTESQFRSGYICACGCCTSRVYWNKWTCEGCGKEVTTLMKPYPKDKVNKDVTAFNQKASKKQKTVKLTTCNQLATKLDPKVVKHRNLVAAMYEVSQFLLPGPNRDFIGSVTVFRANDIIRDRGAYKMFDSLSEEDIGLRRNTVSGGEGRNRGLSRHFQQNWGAMYKFGVTVQSAGFDKAPDAILQAVQQLKWAATAAIPMIADFISSEGHEVTALHKGNVDFNECLSLGYMTADLINYHDDGEKECGPTVASLSLGSPAEMFFRPKHNSGLRKAVSKQPRSMGGDYPDVLAFPLYHGDLLVMNGSQIHRYYEHKVVPHGGRRFALTCRYMDPSQMKYEEDRIAAAVKGALPAKAGRFIYHGDGFVDAKDATAAQAAAVTQADTATQADFNTRALMDAQAVHEALPLPDTQPVSHTQAVHDTAATSGDPSGDRYSLRSRGSGNNKA